jgi:GNAT superfamily N-acetyltransferase
LLSSPIEVRDLRPEEVDDAAGVLARGFRDNPLNVAAFVTIQRQGIGSLIMQEHCRRLDAASEVGYLETDKPENVRFYERLGFEVTGDEPVIGVPNWFMRRPPVSDAGP